MSIENKLNYLSETKDLIKQALINKGMEVDDSTPFREYADKVREVKSNDKIYRLIGKTTDSVPIKNGNVLTFNQDTKMLIDNITSGAGKILTNTNEKLTINTRIVINGSLSQNQMFFGTNSLDTNNGFCIGMDTSNKLGCWLFYERSWVFEGGGSSGTTSKTLNIGESYDIMLECQRNQDNSVLWKINIKNIDDINYETVFEKSESGGFFSNKVCNDICFGGAYIIGSYFYSNIDMYFDKTEIILEGYSDNEYVQGGV